ncbi:macro domain-containing protein [Alicyclobacillus sp.]|uniref:macro domain-containing protein n=1 Tax=Alicyclobacillus sp. TaxID=61169 RepID=UPI0025BB2FDE|nr:macro domain-containing protein [Alicyclobacillus sp.]MCL6516754.1 macro domain-containing protein [Alicyclobacillus sp.]
MQVQVGVGTITLLQGDITHQDVDVIVNAANRTLLGGGGVDGAIHRAAGPELLEECRRIRQEVLHGAYAETAQPVMTRGYRLKARHVIHVVGPICGIDPAPDHHLHLAYWNSLHLAARSGLRSIAFPSISTGAFGCDVRWASRIALGAMIRFLREADSTGPHAAAPLGASAAGDAADSTPNTPQPGASRADAADPVHRTTASEANGTGITTLTDLRMVLFTQADLEVYANALRTLMSKSTP